MKKKPSPPEPSAATRLALEEQYTDKVRLVAKRYADARARFVRNSGLPVGDNHGSELLHDAVVDTWLGAAVWDPGARPLVIHLYNVIKARTWNDVRRVERRVERFPHVSTDVFDDTDLDDDEVELIAAPTASGDCTAVLTAAFVTRVIDELRTLARGDGPVGKVLDCWASEIIESSAVIVRSGLSESAFKAARERLRLLAKKIDPELSEAVRTMLRSAS